MPPPNNDAASLWRMAERRERRERLAASRAATRSVLDLAERLAQDVFPWPLIVHECRLFDTIVKAPSVSTPRSFSLQRRGLLWSIHVVFGEYGFGALQKFHPSAAEIDLNVWRLIADLCPITADWQKLAKIAGSLKRQSQPSIPNGQSKGVPPGVNARRQRLTRLAGGADRRRARRTRRGPPD
jgi:hypothetical protein